jgi:hypothetical protein
MTDLSARIAAALPEYEIEQELGRGAMGVVYLGRHKRLDRTVAIKELPANFAGDDHVRSRFRTEAKVLAALDHPHIVPVYDFVEKDDLLVLVMEELPGGTVWERFTSTGFTPPQACAVVMATAAGLEHAHEQEILHRDVKPDNLMFARDGSLKVTDFGIAKVVGGGQTLATVDGGVLGTPAYMSPEQAKGGEVGPAADVYAAGTMLFELLTGELPFPEAETPLSMLYQRVHESPRPIRSLAPHVPPAVGDVVMKAIATEPVDRYRTAEDFGVAIGEAAATAWGVDWLESSGLVVRGSDRIAAAARTTITPIAPVDVPVTTGPSGERVGSGTVSEGAVAVDEVAIAAAKDMAVKPAGDVAHGTGGDFAGIDAADIIAASEALTPPRFPVIALLLTFGLLAATAVIAIVGFGDPDLETTPELADATLTQGDVELPLVGGDRILVDISEDILVNVNPSVAPDGSIAKLETLLVGIPVGSAEATVEGGEAVIEPGPSQYLVAGALTGSLTILDEAGAETAIQEFPMEATNDWFLTALGIGVLVLLLAVLAYAESNMRPLRKGRRRISRIFGLGLTGAVLGVTAVLASGLFAIVEATIPALIGAAVCGMISIAAAGVAVRTIALRKRLKPLL